MGKTSLFLTFILENGNIIIVSHKSEACPNQFQIASIKYTRVSVTIPNSRIEKDVAQNQFLDSETYSSCFFLYSLAARETFTDLGNIFMRSSI